MTQNLVLNREKSRLLDRRAIDDYGMTGLVLMENAGRGATDLLCRLGIDTGVVLCCGKGNNAGDGFVIARHLDLRGFTAHVLLWTDPKELTGDAAENFRILTKSDVPINVVPDKMGPAEIAPILERADWIVDALLGTGAHGEPRPPFDEAIRLMNTADTPIFAVDLPSGLDCETGIPAKTTVQATHTCTFATIKSGFLQTQAKPYLGELHVADIGTPRRLLEEMGQK
jgi:NAD(P)H-hydrate epimerase